VTLKNKPANMIPQINLKQADFLHNVPEQYHLEITVQWKKGNIENEVISPVSSFAIEGEFLRVTNRLADFRYSYKLKDIKAAYILTKDV